LYPDVHTKHEGQSFAANAIDGDTIIGKREIDLQRPYSISAIKLHLRYKPYNQGQNGLIFSLSNTSIKTSQASIGDQCGTQFSNSTSKQSPEFTCWNSGRYVYVVLYSQNPLQVCEVPIFKVLDLTSVGVAALFHPNKEYSAAGTTAIASKAIDGLSSIGSSGGSGAQNCTGLQRNSRFWRNGRWVVVRMEFQYLRVDIGDIHAIHSIRLHLRDGKDIAKYRYARYRDVYGMDVSVGNSYDISQSRYQCGSQYNSDTQSPTFVCESTTYARYLWMILRNSLKPLFICEVEVYADIRCTVPRNSSNGYYINTRLTYGGILSLSFKEGCRTSSNDLVLYESSGNWRKPLPTCQEITCPDISGKTVENGYLELENTTVGSSATYICSIGFKLQGQDHIFEMTRQCVIHSKNSDFAEWDQYEPKCITDELHCTVDKFVNGKVTYLDRKTLVFFCDTGHSLTPKDAGSLNCVNGSLSGAVPSCKIVNCGLPPELLNGNHVRKVYTFGSEVEYHCDHGYGLLGSNIFTCQANGTWNITLLPTCEPVCQRPDYGSNVGVRGLGNSNLLPVSSTVSYQCKDDYDLQGQKDVHHLKTGKWSDGPPLCKPYCTKPPKLSNGLVAFAKGNEPQFSWVGEKVKYSCNKGNGYILEGAPNVRTCMGALTWSGPAPHCTLGDCGRPSILTNGVCTAANTKFRDTRNCKCDYGYKFYDGCLSSKQATCQVAQNVAFWPKYPNCREILCDDLRSSKTPSNVQLEYRGNKLDNIASYRCSECHVRSQGSLERTCPCNEQWTEEPLQCKKKSCRPLEKPKIGTLRGSSFECGDQVSYSCDSGYILEYDSETRTRTYTGQRTGKQPIYACLEKCDKGRKCTKDPKSGNFRCACLKRSQCPSDFSPICGTDGVTYNNKCLMKVSACEKNQEIDVAAQGECHFGSNCVSCHEDAKCISDIYCLCKQNYIGNGSFCCPKDMGGEVTVEGATGLLRCDRRCHVADARASWRKNGSPLDLSEARYGLAKNGMLLYVENLTVHDSGEYSCKLRVGGRKYYRYSSLEVIGSRIKSQSPCSLNCGKSCARKPFVARGQLTYAGEFPWQAMLCSPPHGQYCGGVLVSSNCIITAAHCLDDHIRNISVCLGRQCGNCSESDNQGNPQCFKHNSFTVHPGFDRRTLDNDIAIIKLPHSPSLDCTSVYPVCLPSKTRDGNFIRAHREGIVTGWGKVNSTVSRSTCLRKGHVRLASRRICDISHGKYDMTSSMMCATDYNGACEGDSGGPLVVQNPQYDNRYVLAGIVSWGIGCGRTEKLGVYTSVLSHLDWIKDSCGLD
jgi:hypothetical protein